MEHRYTKLLEGLREMEDVRAKNPDRLKPVLDQGAGAALTECVATIADTAVSQGAHRNGRSGERREELRLANRLRAARIKRVVEVARLVVPEATQLDVLRMPPGNLNPTELASRALELAQTCDPYLPQLIAGGLPPDGLTQLRAAASELLASGAAKANHRRLQVNATDTLDTTVALVRRVIRSADSLVKSAIEDATDPVRPLDAVADPLLQVCRAWDTPWR